MSGLGSGENGQLTFLDTVNLISFMIGMMNLDSNLNQNDKQDLQEILSKEVGRLLNEIHSHLQKQDEKIDQILEALSNDSR